MSRKRCARLTESYYAMGLTSEAQTAAAVLGSNYPDSQWYKDSYKLLLQRMGRASEPARRHDRVVDQSERRCDQIA